MRIALLLTLLCTALHTRAQRVTNVTAEQLGQELLIHYHLEADGPVEVLLYLSTDRGSRWEGPLKSCSGDVGPNVAPGSGKRIRWEVLKDRELVGDGIAFKVVAKGGRLSSSEVAKRPWLNSKVTYGSVTDIDGNTYATIQIGEQVWMAENLRTTRYRNGDPIPKEADNGKWSDLSSGAWCHYANDPKYEVPYGKLYNWHTVQDPRKLCPAGWHVPTDGEWNTLVKYLDPHNGSYGEFSSTAGGKMKSSALVYWNVQSRGVTNRYGFSGIPSGGRYDFDGSFHHLGANAYWWCDSETVSGLASYRYLTSDNADIRRNAFNKRDGFSVRCLRD
jgi:uncharacterized protein (TIGR02145 family)